MTGGQHIRMPAARLGPGGPAVSRIGLGLAALGRPAYGIQFHVEVPVSLATQWVEIPEYARSLAAVHGDESAGPLLSELARSLPVMTSVARALFGNWLDAFVCAGHLTE